MRLVAHSPVRHRAAALVKPGPQANKDAMPYVFMLAVLTLLTMLVTCAALV